jgi:hypothetical protein
MLTSAAQEIICRGAHSSRFVFPSPAAGKNVTRVYRRGGEWAWCIDEATGPYVAVLDGSFTNVIRIYVRVRDREDFLMVGFRALI